MGRYPGAWQAGLDASKEARRLERSPRYFVSMYTDGPTTRWNVIDRQTQEWVRRFATEDEATAYAAAQNKQKDGHDRSH